jgi:hypothetical protein
MEKDKKQQLTEWLNTFNTGAFVKYNNREYRITLNELKSIYSPLNYWHHETDPSSWLCEALVNLGKRKFKRKLPRENVISLCAQLLNITPEKLESSLEWNANYMAWHDGGTPEDHHAWNKEE